MVVGGALAKKSLRVTKSVTKGYTQTQSKVRNATKNDTSSPTAREMSEIAALTYNQTDFVEIVEVLDKRLNDKGKSWRHVFKALSLINHLLHAGSPNVFHYCYSNIYVFKTLREFQYIDDNGVDVGINVRTEAKEVTRLLINPDALKRTRNGGRRSYDEIVGDNSTQGRPSAEEDDGKSRQRERKEKRRTTEEKDIARAIELGKDEEERRRRAVESSNGGGIFNDLEDPNKKSSDLIDLSDITISSAPLQVQYTQVPLQQQYTTYPLQQQYTSYPAQQFQYTNFQLDPQYTYNVQQEAMQAEYLRQQAEWQAQAQQAQAQTQMQQMHQLYAPQQTRQMQAIAPQPTAFGSNNPFAPGQSPSPSLSTTSSFTTATSSSRMSPATPFSARSTSRGGPSVNDERHAQLASLYADRAAGDDGVDTFGNFGALRYGPTDAGRVVASKTGTASGEGKSYVQSQRTAVF